MSSPLPAGKVLELVDRFKGAVEEIAGRSEQLQEQFHTRLARERRRHETAIEEHNRGLLEAAAEAEAQARAAEAAAQLRYEQRKARIGRAYQASREQGLKKIEDKLGGRRYELQRRMLQAEKDRDNGLAATARSFEEFGRTLAVEQEALSQLERAAQRSFAGYAGLQRAFLAAYETFEGDVGSDENGLLLELRDQISRGADALGAFHRHKVLAAFRYPLLWLLPALVELGLVYLLRRAGVPGVSYGLGAALAGATLLAPFVANLLLQRRFRTEAASLSKTLARARRLHDTCRQQSQVHYQEDLERLRQEFLFTTQSSDQRLKQTQAEAADQRVTWRMRNDERAVRVQARHEQLSRLRRERLQNQTLEAAQRRQQAGELRKQALADAWRQQQAAMEAEHAAALQALQTEWNTRLAPFYQAFEEQAALARALFPSWDSQFFSGWTAPAKLTRAASFARLEVEAARLCERIPKEKALALPGPACFTVPLCLDYPGQGSILLETAATGHDQAVGVLNSIILRLLSTAPPGRLNFTILDPVGLGQNFAGVMHLADYEEQLINNRIWTQSAQIEQKLGDLNEHMEKVIQMYLRNQYQTIAEYNEEAGVIAEKYHFLVIADFPANFSDTAIKRLLSIAASGARCGVHTLIHWDRRLPLPQEFLPDELRKSSFCIAFQGQELAVGPRLRPGARLVLDAPPAPELATEFVHRVGRLSRDSSRVEVPFEHVVPADNQTWTSDTSSELQVAIGRTGATKLQYLAIGKGTRQHGLVAGKTGSGKSTLFHVIITNLSLWCSPDQVEFYLVDFKKGVEFKCYATHRLPHARVVAIESDREFGLSVLQRVDDELRRRGDLFRHLGVQDVPGYKRAGGKEPMPRTLLLVDEFQEFFVEDDKIAQTASLLLDRIVRQGRAFGIHVLLGSQTLGGAYTVARTTLGQMVVRIALQCNEADAYLIMDDSNPAPRLLSRPGEGIYNDMAGALEGNSPFQVVWLPEEVRDRYLSRVRQRAEQAPVPFAGPIVFEGNAPADIRENPLLRQLLSAAAIQPVAASRAWLGAPNSIKGPTEAVFHRQSGNNLLLVGQRDEAILAMVSLGLVALAAQHPPGSAQFILADATPPGTAHRDYLERLVSLIPHPVQLAKPGDLPEILRQLGAEMKQRAEAAHSESAPPVYLFIHGLQRFSRMRYEEDFGFSAAESEAGPNPAQALNDLICEGTRLGFHIIAACDTYNNVSRFLSRKALSEFEMRVLFQMSVNDSASLIDSPKAGLLGLHRALFFNAQEGYIETFRPYALPAPEWLDQAARDLARLIR